MIVRVVHGVAVASRGQAGAPGPALSADDRWTGSNDPERLRQRFARAAARFNGLETLIVGWREIGAMVSGAAGPPDIVVTVWRDAEAMVRAIGANEPAFLAALGVRTEIGAAESYELTSRTFASLPTPTSLLRIVTLRARARGEAAFFDQLRIIEQRLTEQGLTASHIARRVGPAGIEALIAGVWRDRSAAEAASGPRPDAPAYLDEVAPWIDDLTVELYSALEIAPRLPMASGPPILILDGSRRIVDLTPAAAATLGRTQDEAVGVAVEDLAALDEADEAALWSRLLEDRTPGDKAGAAAWSLPPDGRVMIRWRMRPDVPVPGRHTILVRRSVEAEPTGDELDAALAEAFPRVDAEPGG